jgi:hypothetical protein
LKQYDQALNDATRVVTLKSQWAKVRVDFNDDENTYALFRRVTYVKVKSYLK